MITQIKTANRTKIILASTATLFIFFIDILTPRGINEANLYLIPILFTIGISGRRFTIIISIIAILLTFIGFYLSPEGVPIKIAIINRLYDTLGIFACVYILLKYKASNKMIEQQNGRLVKSVEDLKDVNDELKTFNYIASHDLQEPLRMIKMFSQKIIQVEKFSDKTQSYFNFIIDASDRMHNLISSLITYSSIDKTELHFVSCDLNTVVEESKKDLHLRIVERQAIIACENLPTINGLPIQLFQVFTNLIGNSIKYCRPEIKPYIKITSERIHGTEINYPTANLKQDYYFIKIVDNGIGFEDEYATKIFKPFKRLHGREEYTGTGIGLSIVKKIVTNHNGFITAKSKVGIGSTFAIYIPVS